MSGGGWADNVVELRLSNGLRVVVVPRQGPPTVALRLVFPLAGAGPDARSVLDVVAGCLLDAPCQRTGTIPAAALADAGAQATVGVESVAMTISATALADGFPATVQILGDVLADPAYAQPDVTRRARSLAARPVPDDDPRVVERLLLRRRFGSHPLVGSVDTVVSTDVSVDTVRDEHDRWLRPADATLVLVGRLDAPDLVDVLERGLHRWTGTGHVPRPVPPAPEPEPVSPTDIAIVRRSGGAPGLLMAGPGVPYGHPDQLAAQLANLALGGSVSARLGARLRRTVGVAYQASSGWRRCHAGTWNAIEVTSAPNSFTRVVAEVHDVLDGVSGGDVTDGDVDAARRLASARPSLATASQSALAAAIAGFVAMGMPATELATIPARARAVETAHVRRVLARDFRAELFSGVATLPEDERVPSMIGGWRLQADPVGPP